MSDDLVRDALAAYRAKTGRLLGFSQQQPPEPATPPGKMPAGPRGGTSPPADFVRAAMRRRY